jgi:hypothetical protein
MIITLHQRWIVDRGVMGGLGVKNEKSQKGARPLRRPL